MDHGTASEARRRLVAARMAGVAASGIVAQVAVDMPEGFFGAADRVTLFGWLYSVVLTLAAAASVAALRSDRRATAWLAPVVLAANVGVFVPALGSDPLIAGLVIVWNLVLLAQQLFPPAAVAASALPDHRAEPASALAVSGPALRHLALASLALSVGVVGYRLSGGSLAEWVCLILGYGTLAAALPLLRELARARHRTIYLLAVPVAGSLLALGSPRLMLSLLAVAQATLVALIVSRHQTTAEIVRAFFDHPSRLIAASFATAIAVGTVLLTFPAAAARGTVAPLDALFTATSATCVTGLIVLDTPHDFSLFGQVVILVLIQVGGLGIMTLSTFGALLLGGGLGLRGERALAEMLDLQTAPTAYRLTRFIVLATLTAEAVGAAILTACFSRAGLPLGEAAWRGVFHSVSAFCNAGFALQSDSVVMFREAPVPLLTHAALIVLGGLGFVVLAAAWNRLSRRDQSGSSVQVRVVLAASACLLVAGALIYGACEWNRTLDGLSVPGKLLNAFFQSVTLRTAGFNSVGFEDLGPATALVMIVFMFIGASPGSTGGGIKTTTLAVLLATLRSTAGGGAPPTLFRREIPREIVLRSLAIVVTSALLIGAALFLLLLFESQPFLHLMFEATSAFATVGLSLGATAELGPAGKLIIIAGMFIGRIGPLTLALLLGTSASRRPPVQYAETRLMVG